MKRILVLFICLLSVITLFANPIVPPIVKLSELYFDNQGNWVIELSYHYYSSPYYQPDEMHEIPVVDKLILTSSTDTVTLTNLNFAGNDAVLVFRQDSLSRPFHIQRQGDAITTMCYWVSNYPTWFSSLKFGDYPGAQISTTRTGQSITDFGDYWVKDNSPTIGMSNDTAGIYGTLKGVVYDKFSRPVPNVRFYSNFEIKTTADGSYSTRIPALQQSFNTLAYWVGGNNLTQYVKANDVSFVMEPDSVIIQDIHLINDLVSGFSNIPEKDIFRLYPNPLNKSDKLKYELNLPVVSANFRIEILTVDGKLLLTKRLSDPAGDIELHDLKGLLVINLWMDKKIIATNRIFVNQD